MLQYVSGYYGLHNLRVAANRSHHRHLDENGARIVINANSVVFFGGILDFSNVVVLGVYNLHKINRLEAPLFGINFPNANGLTITIGVQYTGGVVTIEEILTNDLAPA